MHLFETLRAALAAWFERAVSAKAGELRWQERPVAELRANERRGSIRRITREQLGIVHWSCHTHF